MKFLNAGSRFIKSMKWELDHMDQYLSKSMKWKFGKMGSITIQEHETDMSWDEINIFQKKKYTFGNLQVNEFTYF